jgi:hypothetical protein
MNTIVILDGKEGRLANQLWLYASVYGYCLEKKYACKNYSFFKYNKYFKINTLNWFNFLSWLPNKMGMYLYKLLIILPLQVLQKKYCVIHDDREEFLLPPTHSRKVNHKNKKSY